MRNLLQWLAGLPEKFWESLRPEEPQERQKFRRPGRILAIVNLILYALSFAVWTAPLNFLTSYLPPISGGMIRVLIPSAFGTVACTAASRLFPQERRAMAAAFRYLRRLTVLVLLALEILLWGERRSQLLLLHFCGRFVLLPLIFGSIAAVRVYYNWWKDHPV